MSTLLKKLRNKTHLVTATVFITAATTSLAVYAGHYISAAVPGSVLAQAVVPVGASTVQQMLLIIWSEVSGHAKPQTSSITTSEEK
jgi:hypothetical protein